MENYAAVWCPIHGLVTMDRDEYDRQMARGDSPWRCPKMVKDPLPGACGETAVFSDAFWDEEHV